MDYVSALRAISEATAATPSPIPVPIPVPVATQPPAAIQFPQRSFLPPALPPPAPAVAPALVAAPLLPVALVAPSVSSVKGQMERLEALFREAINANYRTCPAPLLPLCPVRRGYPKLYLLRHDLCFYRCCRLAVRYFLPGPHIAICDNSEYCVRDLSSCSLQCSIIHRYRAPVGAPHLDDFHYFVISSSGMGISPKWDFTSTGKFAGNATPFVIGAKVGDILAPSKLQVVTDRALRFLPFLTGGNASLSYRPDQVQSAVHCPYPIGARMLPSCEDNSCDHEISKDAPVVLPNPNMSGVFHAIAPFCHWP
ncbi:hypothetical protein MVEN_00689100 [Mycena venus]|uniref:Uncharacterized protein n=1 Tax=Mycena venus TaxID=2733690 RepID=A0A8H7D308_9AGAR|nr:hypothetical protein MVEN_00689100 [Mycena venus]